MDSQDEVDEVRDDLDEEVTVFDDGGSLVVAAAAEYVDDVDPPDVLVRVAAFEPSLPLLVPAVAARLF